MKRKNGPVIFCAAAVLIIVAALAVWLIGSGSPRQAEGVRLGQAGGRPESSAQAGEQDRPEKKAGTAGQSGNNGSTGGDTGSAGNDDLAKADEKQPDSAVITVTTAGAEGGAGEATGTGNGAEGGAGEAAGTENGMSGAGQSAGTKNGAGGAGEAPGTGNGADGGSSGAAGQDITLLFAGDVYFSDHVMGAYNRAGGISGVLDEGIRAEIGNADIFMVNQEFPFTDRGTAAADKQFTFRVPPEQVSMFQEMGIDIVTMANNHILDFGPEGITDSLAALDGAGILHVGAGENLDQARKLEIIEVKGKKIGFLGTSRVYMAASWAAGADHPGVFSTYDPALPLESIRAARSRCDYLVVYVHWGIERNTAPETYQRNMGRQYIDAGADLVVGSHPHVLQEIEYYNGKPIAYSLGNFVFGSSIPETELLKVVLKEDGSGGANENGFGGQTEVTTIPCTSSGGYTRLR